MICIRAWSQSLDQFDLVYVWRSLPRRIYSREVVKYGVKGFLWVRLLVFQSFGLKA